VNRRRNAIVTLAAIAAGSYIPVVGCGDLGTYLGRLNPCGTILVCDPVQYRFISSGYDGPGADPQVDPACTYPPFCAGDPFVQTQTTGNQ